MSGFGKGAGFGGGRGKSRKMGGDRKLPYKNPHENPFKKLGDPTGDYQKDSADEVEAVGEAFKGFKERMKTEKKRFELATDAAFWSGICFKSHADRTKFLKAVGVLRLYDGQHIDGYQFAEILGLDIEWEDR